VILSDSASSVVGEVADVSVGREVGSARAVKLDGTGVVTNVEDLAALGIAQEGSGVLAVKSGAVAVGSGNDGGEKSREDEDELHFEIGMVLRY
jgi:hypothetical protein